MKRMVVAALAAVVVIAGAFGAPRAIEAQAALSPDVLKNTTYPSTYTVSKQAPLRDGKYDQRAALNDPSKPALITFTDSRLGGSEGSAAVLLASNTGGSGVFLDLHLVTTSAGLPQPGPGLFLGDRLRVDAFTYDGTRVRLELTVQGPTDPQCCPTQREVREYVREGNTFREVSKLILQPGSGPLTPSAPKTGNAGLAADPHTSLVVAILVSIVAATVAFGARRTTSTRVSR